MRMYSILGFILALALATLGWPDEKAMKEKGLDYFYPTSALVTGPDIIFFG